MLTPQSQIFVPFPYMKSDIPPSTVLQRIKLSAPAEVLPAWQSFKKQLTELENWFHRMLCKRCLQCKTDSVLAVIPTEIHKSSVWPNATMYIISRWKFNHNLILKAVFLNGYSRYRHLGILSISLLHLAMVGKIKQTFNFGEKVITSQYNIDCCCCREWQY